MNYSNSFRSIVSAGAIVYRANFFGELPALLLTFGNQTAVFFSFVSSYLKGDAIAPGIRFAS
jgi:hypothetical protein